MCSLFLFGFCLRILLLLASIIIIIVSSYFSFSLFVCVGFEINIIVSLICKGSMCGNVCEREGGRERETA